MLRTFLVILLAACPLFAQSVTKAGVDNSLTNTSSAVSSSRSQDAINALVTLPDADALVYMSPHRILNEAGPKVTTQADLTEMRQAFADIKKAVGIDPSSIDSMVIAVRFHKPSAALSFIPPDLLAVASGDFSSESLLTVLKLYLQDRARDERYGSKAITIIKLDPISAAAEKNVMLKPYEEIAVASLNISTVAVGNVGYVKAALDAADGNGRINMSTLNSLMRDPSALLSVAGSPLAAFAKAFGLLGTETTSREARCDTRFGEFYGAVKMEENNFTFRGAMNADNPDTARIISGLLSGLLQQSASSLSDPKAENILKSLKLTTRESEILFEAAIPQDKIADFMRRQPTNKPPAIQKQPKKPLKKRRTRR